MEINNKPVWRKYEGIHVYCRDQFASALPGSGPDFRNWLEQSVTVLKSNEKKESGHIIWPDKRTFFFKRFRVDSFPQKAAYLLFRDHAERSFRLSLELISLGISVPGPVAVIRDLKSKHGSVYFICEALANTRTLKKYVKMTNKFCDMQKLVGRFALEMAVIHHAGYFHGDLKWKNIMLGPEPESRSYYIDLDTAGKLRSAKDKRYSLDLARFCVDIAENAPDQNHVLDFIFAYSRATGKEPEVVVSHMMPYHKRISAKHKVKYGSNIPSLNLKP
jgi:tRNA A-37 threonylcarbamoyl transferase component Bud32